MHRIQTTTGGTLTYERRARCSCAGHGTKCTVAHERAKDQRETRKRRRRQAERLYTAKAKLAPAANE